MLLELPIQLLQEWHYDAEHLLHAHAHVHVYVWFTRLIFEMIADPAIKNLMECLHQPGIVPIRDVVQQKTCDKPMFRSTQSASHDNPSYRYSMAGLMKSAESAGYPMSDGQPDRLKVQLYDFQKSTYQWMLDQDTGGAIRAPGRADLYLGAGNRATALAGEQAEEGRLYYFFLKHAPR